MKNSEFIKMGFMCKDHAIKTISMLHNLPIDIVKRFIESDKYETIDDVTNALIEFKLDISSPLVFKENVLKHFDDEIINKIEKNKNIDTQTYLINELMSIKLTDSISIDCLLEQIL